MSRLQSQREAPPPTVGGTVAETSLHQAISGIGEVRVRSSSSSSSSYPSINQTAIAPSMQVDDSNEDRSKRQQVTHGADMELEGHVMESERD